MIHTWSDLFAAIKKWFDTPLDFKKKEEIEPLEPETAKKINDLMKPTQKIDWDAYYRSTLPEYMRNPYYKNLKTDDSCWQDQLNYEVKSALDAMQTEPDPVKREERRKAVIKKIREKYGLDHP